MDKFENYKNNLDINDKHHLKEVHVHNNVIYNGDVDIITKPKHEQYVKRFRPLATAILGPNNTAAPISTKSEFYHAWTDIDAQEFFLNAKPTCYLVWSKPGAGAYAVGEAISKKFNCVHLCPRNVILDEIEQKSPTGTCIDFNMKHNKVCQFDYILSLIKMKLESPTVQHRGYVISGLPLVTSSRSDHYLLDCLNGEEALLAVDELLLDTIFNLKKKKGKDKNTTSHTSVSSAVGEGEVEEAEEEQQEEGLEEEIDDRPVELPKFILNSCKDIIFPKKPYCTTKKMMLLQQMQELFSLTMAPDFVIYITCPDIDLVTKRSHKFINYTNSQCVTEPFTAKTTVDLRWPSKYSSSDYTSPYDSHTFNPKYCCKHPIDFMDRSIEQMCNYKHHLLQFIEKKVKEFDPKFVIKMDARISCHHIIHQVVERLTLLPTKPVIIPEPLYLEDPSNDMEEFWKSVEELNPIRCNTVTFNLCASPWLNRCPVELKKRQSTQGNPKYAVRFFKHVYLISTLDNMIDFCRNPRPYLKTYYLEPTCRIIVMGTKSTGKSMISHCLSWIFDCPIISYANFLAAEKQKKYETFAISILSEIIATIEDNRFATWQSLETERLSKLNIWRDYVLQLLIMYIPLLEENYSRMAKKDGIELEHEQLEPEEEHITDDEFKTKFNSYREQLSLLPILDDLEMCKTLLEKDALLNYAPQILLNETEKPKIPVIGDDDVTEAVSAYIVANDLQKEIEPTVEELMNQMTSHLLAIDQKCQEDTNFEDNYGKCIIDDFPSDPEYWGYLSDSKLLPDYTITILENREIETELLMHYYQIENCIKNYQERFLSVDDPLIKTKLQMTKLSDTKVLDMQIIASDLVKASFNNIVDDADKREYSEVNIDAEEIASFTEAIEKFKENWDSTKIKLEEHSKACIEIEIGDKTDIQIIEEVLLMLRKSYCLTPESNENEEVENEDEETQKDVLTYNSPQLLSETNIYCPIAFYDYGVLWEGKAEFSVKYDNRIYNLCKEECLEKFTKDITKYQSYNDPFKNLPSLRICVIGCIGSGKTSISKFLAKELGLIHIDFSEMINNYLLPRHMKKVGRKYENSFTDTPIDEEGVTEFQMGEENDNLISDIMSNETELRRMINNYFERGSPIISILMQGLIKKCWFQDPFVTTGFVLDGYPKLPNDVEDMVASFCIPDLVIEIEGGSDIAIERLSTMMFRKWKTQLNEAKAISRKKLDEKRKEWMTFITKNIVAKLVLDDIIEAIFTPINKISKLLSTQSLPPNPSKLERGSSGASIVDANLFNTYNEMIQAYPEPVDEAEWENVGQVRERIDARLEATYEVEVENIQAIKDILLEQKIKIVSINGTKSLNKVTRVALSKLTNLKNRCQSFLEQTFIITFDIAELLLSLGYFFLSKFQRMCPVYIQENLDTIMNPYKIFKRKGGVFPVAHRSYIYYLNGEENLRKFRTNPLKYVDSNSIKLFTEYPLRIGVIGSPKSGKSSLAEKIAKSYGLLCVSRGSVVRHILEHFHWTELASKMLAVLRQGECIDSELIIKAVQTVVLDQRSISHGLLFDGFPETPSEAMELNREGLYPIIIFDIQTDKAVLLENSQKEIYNDILKVKPPYSRPFIEHRMEKWQETSYIIRNWINNDFQNMYQLNGNESRWQCLQLAKKITKEIVKKIHYYICNVKTNIVPADVMCISNDIFQERMSPYKNLCPLCFCRNTIRHSGFPVDKKGIVQFQNKFYWICSDHMPNVLNYPTEYLNTRSIDIPEIAAPVKLVEMAHVYENGVCIVTYAECLPAQKIVAGSHKFAANFRGKFYLFCNEVCLKKFLAKPHMYSDVFVFKETNIFPELTLKKLPNIGYLEQTIGNILTDACCALNVTRPKYPGLDVVVSGMLFIALYFKRHNPLTDKSFLPLYLKAYKTYNARCKLMIDVGLRLRSMDNPFAKYPICSHTVNTSRSASIVKSSRSSASVVTGRSAASSIHK